MSEDPVKYEPMASKEQIDREFELKPGEIMTEDQMVQCIPAKQYREMLAKLTELDHSVDANTMIRIEALRAAAAMEKMPDDSVGKGCVELVIARAKQFAAYLESGE